ncbi:MAG: glycosyltransferase family 4 protein [Muribaculaceae bacterium]|nr:glycosyltransferase family 4 protein [Muribaculaceae bacterium]
MSQPDKKLIAFHQLNDFSGSPKVLSMTINALLEDGYEIDLVTTEGGCLDLIKSPNLKVHYFPYKFTSNKAATLFRSTLSQFHMFFYGLRHGKGKKFLINTIMPIGGALAGKILGSEIFYHYHENAFYKGFYYKMKAKVMLALADRIFCVSKYQKGFLPQRPNIDVIPNALFKSQKDKLTAHTLKGFESKEILLVSSLRAYKGVTLFARLAQRMPDYKFVLVANATNEEICNYWKSQKVTVPPNLSVFTRQKDVTPFYNSAGLLVNLSDKRYFVETFGLTVLEAMAAGVPVIVPDEGGIVELVDNGRNGYVVDVRNIDIIEETARKVFSDYDRYVAMSENAIATAAGFSEKKYNETITKAINHKK